MNLRPHHALCIQKFTGHGYDGRFTEHMASVCQTLREYPETEVTIISGCDDLCSACPNNKEGSCSALRKVESMDTAVRRALDLEPGVTLPWQTLSAAARERIFGTEEFRQICGTCQWYALCTETAIF